MPSRRKPARYSSRVTRPSPSASYSSTTSSVGASPLPMFAGVQYWGSPFDAAVGAARCARTTATTLRGVSRASAQPGAAGCARFDYLSRESLCVKQALAARGEMRRRIFLCSDARARRRLLDGFLGRIVKNPCKNSQVGRPRRAAAKTSLPCARSPSEHRFAPREAAQQPAKPCGWPSQSPTAHCSRVGRQ